MPANDQSYMLARLPREHITEGNISAGRLRKGPGARPGPGLWHPGGGQAGLHGDLLYPRRGLRRLAGEARVLPHRPGNFVDKEGKVLGRHRGIHCYTLGQGRGLGVSGPHRYYVDRPAGRTPIEVVLSDGSDLGRDEVRGTEPNWLAVDGLTGPMEVTVRLRHSKTQLAATLEPEGGRRASADAHPRPRPHPRPAGGVLRRRRRGGLGLDCMREKERTMDMKKLLGLALACALLLTGCGARGGDKGEELGDNPIRPLERHRAGGGPAEAGGGLRREAVWPV